MISETYTVSENKIFYKTSPVSVGNLSNIEPLEELQKNVALVPNIGKTAFKLPLKCINYVTLGQIHV